MENDPIRILMVVTIMNRGGAETMIMNYMRNIDRNKIQFDFLVHRNEPGTYDDEIQILGGKIHVLPTLSWRNILSYSVIIRRFLEQHPEYECIHIHPAGVALFVARAAKQLGRKVIIQHSHCCSPNHIDWVMPLRFFARKLTPYYLTHYFSCGIEAARWQFGTKLAKRAIILPNAIDAKLYRFSENRRQKIRKEMGWEKKFIIGNVARFSPQKNHFRLIRIFEAVLKKKRNALLVLIGEKQGYYAQLVREIHTMGLTDYVIFTGGRSDVSELLQGFDVVLFPSLYEGLSVAMIEQQAAGLKIVASSTIAREVAVCPELVQFLSLDMSDEKWAEQLLEGYERRDKYTEIQKAGFDIQQNARWLQDFYLKQAQK